MSTTILQLSLIFLYFHIFPAVYATNCFYCISPDKHYNATVRRQLATQTDIFFYPIGVKSSYCSEPIDPYDPQIIEGQICSKYSMCVTLFPNLPDSTFVVRGCLESILRHAFREDQQLHQDGCYLLRSLPTFPNTLPMDYVVCTCHGDYCNNIELPRPVERPYSFGRSSVLKLAYSDDEQSLQIATSSTNSRKIRLILLFFSTFSSGFLRWF